MDELILKQEKEEIYGKFDISSVVKLAKCSTLFQFVWSSKVLKKVFILPVFFKLLVCFELEGWKVVEEIDSF